MRLLASLILISSLAMAGLRESEAQANLALTSTGSGFIVSSAGDIVSNAHVVDDCNQILVRSHTAAKLVVETVAVDAHNDLALLRLPGPARDYAVFRDGASVRVGDSILALGFPLQGILTSRLSATNGVISSLSGLRDDTRYIQITAPVQAGNSGGPLLDQSGHVVGVVVGKLDAVKIAKLTGDLPQNVNFAITGSLVRAFLDASRVQYSATVPKSSVRAAEIADRASKYTVSIECWRLTEAQVQRRSPTAEQVLAEERRRLEAERKALEAERKQLEAMRTVPKRPSEDPLDEPARQMWLLVTPESKVLEVTKDTLMVSVTLCKSTGTSAEPCKQQDSYKTNAKVRFRDVREVYFRTGEAIQPVASIWVRGSDVQFSPLKGPRPEELTIRLYVTDSWKLGELRSALEKAVGRTFP